MSGRVLCIVVVHPSLYSLQADKKALEETEAELKKEMTSLKERNHSLEQMLNELLSKGDVVVLYFACLFVEGEGSCCAVSAVSYYHLVYYHVKQIRWRIL